MTNPEDEKPDYEKIPIGFVPQKRFDEGSAVAAGTIAAVLSLVNPVLGVAASGLAPLVANRLNELYSTRLQRAMNGLREKHVDLEAVLLDGPDAVIKADTLRDFIAASMETGSKEKVQFLLHLAEFGLKSEVRIDVLFAKRVIRTLARLDELEMILLAELSRSNQNLKGVKLATLMKVSTIADVNVLRSGLAVLQSEGLITQDTGESDVFSVSDYGESVLTQLRKAVRDIPSKGDPVL